ncbi:MAG: ribonuclease H-like domain-containing protein [Sandaracinaceae bacterium]|nr:ribonuclease H-like domain-containing protein [Sandaracinaceae bacterium]
MTREDEWLFGWDETPGIVSVWADGTGLAHVFRRIPETRALVHEQARFRPWILLASLEDLAHLGGSLAPTHDTRSAPFTYEALDGPGALRFRVSAHDQRALHAAILAGASRRLGRRLNHVRELGVEAVFTLPPEEQYLVSTGRTYFRDLPFDALVRMQLDLETTGLDPETSRIFLVAVRDSNGAATTIEAEGEGDAAEADLIRRLAALVRAQDPDVIENHNLHGFDLPFLARRARKLGVPLVLGRLDGVGLSRRPSARGTSFDDAGGASMRRARYTMPGRELIDTLDAVRRHDFAARDLPGHGLKAVARHFGLARDDRPLIPGARVYATFLEDPERVRDYAREDVHEAGQLARLLGGAAFALARMAARRYERIADAGPATGVIDPLLVRAYLREGKALPAHEAGDGTLHTGAALHLFATGVAERIVKADVASLYPSLMRQYQIGPKRDHLGVLLTVVDRLVEGRLAAKARARAAAPGSPERHTDEALSAAMKLIVNSAYGYLGATSLTRFADVHAANEVTRRGRETLAMLCRELAQRGVTLLEADTDGVYFSVPVACTEADERRVVSEVDALLPPLVSLEYDGRYRAMLSHESKNYALLGHDGEVRLKGVAFRSSRAEPFGEAFLRRAIGALLVSDVAHVREVYVEVAEAIRYRKLPTREVTARVRVTKTRAQYLAARDTRREHTYEALLASGRPFRVGEKVRVYRRTGGQATVLPDSDDEVEAPRDYDTAYYERLLRDTYATRLSRAFTPEDFAAVFADRTQLTLFPRVLADVRPVLERRLGPSGAKES